MDVSRLLGLWFHSREEDKKDRVVYRGRSYDFPRSRAPRRSLKFESDGTVIFGSPGPADGATTTKGTWKVADKFLILTAAGLQETYEIELIEDELLFLKPREYKEV